MAIFQKYASDPRPPHTRQQYEQTSGQNMTPNASKQGKFGSLGTIYLFIFLSCMWGLGSQKESPNLVLQGSRHPRPPYTSLRTRSVPGSVRQRLWVQQTAKGASGTSKDVKSAVKSAKTNFDSFRLVSQPRGPGAILKEEKMSSKM